MKGNTLTAMIALLHAIGLNAQSFEWTKSFGGSLADYGLSIALDASGNVYTTGYFQGTVDFDPGAGTTNLTSEGSLDVYVQKLNATGNFVWA
ncbi:MAG: SBBP repeat-containing protein, partial [Flavobacteriales bacterium]|nr:SBBP repeat-containing protein [Flavobacteriales bacterium]